MRTWKQLSLLEREILYAGLESGRSLRELGRRLDRHHTSLGRELRRNAKYGLPYLPCKAHGKYLKRVKDQRAKAPLKDPEIFLYVREHLRKRWSPETIAGRWTKKHPDRPIHFETIYRYIYRSEQRQDRLWRYLPNHKPKRTKKEGRSIKRNGKIPEAKSIDLRPRSVEKRQHIGHWETDNMQGKQSDLTTLSLVEERLTRYTLLDKLPDRKASSKKEAVLDRLLELPKPVRLTLTADNGLENIYHREWEASLGIKTYFCHAYHSWEKGAVENTVGRVRRFIPKGESLDDVPEEKIREVEHWLNHTPRKCLDFETPHEKMMELMYVALNKLHP